MPDKAKTYEKPSFRSVQLTADELKRIAEASDPQAELTRIALRHFQHLRKSARISQAA